MEPNGFAVGGRKPGEENFCKQCHRCGKRNIASVNCSVCREKLCNACGDSHRRDHSVAPIMPTNPPNTVQNGTGDGASEGDVPCPKHQNKMIEFYCAGHKQVFCYVCSTVEHRTEVCSVSYIPEISARYLTGIDGSSRIRRLDSLLTTCCVTHRQAADTVSLFEEAYEDTLKQIENFRAEINATLDNWQGKLKAELERRRRSSAVLTSSNLQRFSELKRELEQLQTRVLQQKTANDTDRLFIELIQAEFVLEENERNINSLNNPGQNSFKFRRNTKIVDLLRTEDKLGELVPVAMSRSSSLSGSITSNELVAVSRKEVTVKMKHEKQTSWITSIVALSADKIVVADYKNLSIKLIDTRGDKILSQAVLTSGPWEMAKLPNNDVVATLFDEEALEFLSTSNTIRSRFKIQTGGRCQGVTFSNNRLIVTFIMPPKYNIYDASGHLLSTSRELINLKSMYHISASKDNQSWVAANGDANSIVKIGFDGTVLGEFKDPSINAPRGVACDSDGTVFVCSKKDHSVLRVSADLRNRTIVLRRDSNCNSIKNPYAVCHDPSNRLLYVSCASGKSKYDNFVRVFEMDELVGNSMFTPF